MRVKRNYHVGGLVLLVLSLWQVSTSLFAADTTQNQQVNYVDFRKGLNTKVSDFLLGTDEGVVYDNAILDATEGTLKKRDPFLTAYVSAETDSPTSIYRLYLADETEYTLRTSGNTLESCVDSTGTCTKLMDFSISDHKFDWETYNNIAYGTDGYNNIIKTNGVNATYAGTAYAEDAGSGAGPNGTYTYKITFYTSSYEVGWAVLSNSVTVSDNDIDLTMIPIAVDTYLGEDVIGRKVYRNSDGGSDYKLLTNGTIADNTTTILTDSDADAARGDAYSVDDTCTPPQGRLIHLFNSRIFVANNPNAKSRLYASEILRPECFLSDQYIDVRLDDGDQITVLETWLSNLVLSKDNSWIYVYMNGATELTDATVSDPMSPKGCRSIYSARTSPLGIFFLSGDGIYLFTGQYAQLKSNKISPTILSIDQINREDIYGAFTKNKYYLTFSNPKLGESANNTTLIYDTISDAFTMFTLGFSCFDVFTSGTDNEILYGGSMSDGNIYGFSEADYKLIHRKHTDFTGTWTEMRYLPTRWGGDDQNAEIEIARTATINSLSGIINDLTGTIDRSLDNGSYISQIMSLNAAAFDKLYWNESIPSSGGNVEFYLRSAADSTAILAASWEGPYTNPAGSDISAATCDAVFQYKIVMTTNDIRYSPQLYSTAGYVVKITYSKSLTPAETSIPFEYESGWEFLKAAGYNKEMTYAEFEFTGSGTFTVLITNELGLTETFEIDMDDYPNGYYKASFNNKFVAKRIKINITKNDLLPFSLKKMTMIYDIDNDSITGIENGL